MQIAILKTHIYVRGFGLNDRRFKFNILSVNEESSSNICPIGSWLIYSENYLKFKEKYNIDEIYASLIDKDNVYLVIGNIVLKNGNTELDTVVTYIEEHYDIEKIKIEETTNFDNKIYVYKLSR